MRARCAIALAALCGALLATSTHARNHRSQQARHEFQREHPCPSTGRSTGHCPGYIIDHRVALCVGGRDESANMRWQTFDESLRKDRWECRADWRERLAECETRGCFVTHAE